jgi:glycosyltransferase involved in cell wall biosynthesis
MKGTFVITCKYSQEHSLLFNCLRSIREYNPEHEIFIVDSDSDDKSYFEEAAKQYGATIENIKNKNFTTGAVWHMYNNHKRDYYYFLHDSTEVLGNFDHLTKNKVVPILLSNIGFKWPVWPVKRKHDSKWNNANRSYKWAEEKVIEHTPFNFRTSGFRCIGGPKFLCDIEVLDKLHQSGFNKILPSTKQESEMMERLWGFAFDELGYSSDMSEVVLLKGRQQPAPRIWAEVDGVSVRKNEAERGDLIIKYWAGRK